MHELHDVFGHLRVHREPKLQGLFGPDRVVVGPPARGEGPGQLTSLLIGELGGDQLEDGFLHLGDGFPCLVGQDQGLVVDVGDRLLFHDFQEGGGGILAELGIHGAQDGVVAHDDLVGRQGDEGAAGHGVVGDVRPNLGGVVREGAGDLEGGQDQTARREQLPQQMRDYVDRIVEAKLKNRSKRVEDLVDEIPFAPGKRIQLDPQVRHFLYWEANNRHRIELLERLVDLDLRIYGNEDWIPLTKESPLRDKFLGPMDPNTELPSLFASAQVNLNIHSVQCSGSLNQRDFNAPVAGGFLLSDWVPGAGRFFEPEVEAAYFTDSKDLRAKVEFFLEHPDLREQIVRAGKARVLDHHTYNHRVGQLLDTLSL